MRQTLTLAALSLISGCSTVADSLFDAGKHSESFYYLGQYYPEYYLDVGKRVYDPSNHTTDPLILTPYTFGSGRAGGEPNHYWPLATDEITQDIRNLFIQHTMRHYRKNYDFDYPINYQKTPMWKPYMSYGRISNPVTMDTRHNAHSYNIISDDQSKLLYFKAMLLRYADQPVYLDLYANQCFAGFGPADKKRSNLQEPKNFNYCYKNLFRHLTHYIPMITEEKSKPTNDNIKYGQVYKRFRIYSALEEGAPVRELFESDSLSQEKKRRLAAHLIVQMKEAKSRSFAPDMFANFGGYFNDDAVQDLEYVIAISANPKYLYHVDPHQLQLYGFVDARQYHDYIQKKILGFVQVNPARYAQTHSRHYARLMANSDSEQLNSDFVLDPSDAADLPSSGLTCRHNILHQTIALERAQRMSYNCFVKEENFEYIDLPKRVRTEEEDINLLTVYYGNRLVNPSKDDHFITSFITVNNGASRRVKERMSQRLWPNAFKSQLVNMKGSLYGVVQHHGVVYYYQMDGVEDYLRGYL